MTKLIMPNKKFIFMCKLLAYIDMHLNRINVCVVQAIREGR